MKINTGLKFYLVLVFLFTSILSGVPTTSLAQEDSTAVQIERVKELINYLEFALNTLGDAYTPSREKDIIISIVF